jgi:hypothetical protein
MSRAPFALALCLLFLATPALAQKDDASAPDKVTLKNGQTVTGKVLDDDPKTGVTIKQANGKVRVIAAKDVKMVDRADTAAKPAPKPTPQPKDEDEDTPPPPKPAKQKPADDDDDAEATHHKGTTFGVGGDLGMVLSRENAAGSLKVLSPDLGIHGTLDSVLSGALYFRLDPAIATFARTSSVVVPTSIDTTDPAHIVVHQETVTNKIRVIDLTVRAALGYDWLPILTSRLGLRLGLDLASGNGVGCPNDSRTSLAYGLATTPIAARFGKKDQLELGLFFDYVVLTMPRCSAGDTSGFVVPQNAVTKFSLQVSDEKISLAELGLSATYMFW